ncbi:MAG: PVC-type heme-binding CxxCH protein [Gemmataceae bacterium]
MQHRILVGYFTVLLLGCLALDAAPPRADADGKHNPTDPLTPKQELATFRLPRGFKVELVACEPNIVDPVAMAFDEQGRLFVAEMSGYPNAGVATGKIASGKIKVLEDKDGDGYFESATTYADGLRFPTSVMPYKGGLLVANAPDLVYLYPDKEGRFQRRALYTGFALDNIQQLLNSLQWGLDNWVYACAGGSGGTIRSAENANMPPVTLRGRGIRFHPDQPGSLEPTSGGGQFGLASDEWEQWFTATNNQHLRHIVLPDHYLRRNPELAVSAVTLDIPDHEAACKVFRISPFEAWRVERTQRRKEGPDAQRFPSTELVPGGYITSACSPVVYTGGLFPPRYHGNTFVCDPANNLVHRDVLTARGATFVAQRGDPDCEFLASTDPWFRPVNLTIGPDGALYVADFYREVIETPISLPDDIKRKLNLESRGRGRIWRVVPEGFVPTKMPHYHKEGAEDLVRRLEDANSWGRLTAQRLLGERQDAKSIAPLEKLAREAAFAPGRAHALWTLDGLGGLKDGLVLEALKDKEGGIREQALRLSETRLVNSSALREAVAKLADDPSPRVRFQLAFTLGALDTPKAAKALTKIARRDTADPWTQTAILSSARNCSASLLENLLADKEFTKDITPPKEQFLGRLAAILGARPGDKELARVLNQLGDCPKEADALTLAVLKGLGAGMHNSGRALAAYWRQSPASLKEPLERIRPIFQRSLKKGHDEKRAPGERAAAIGLLAYGPFTEASQLQDLLEPKNPLEVQLAVVRALSVHDDVRAADTLLASWAGFSPVVRREVLEALFARKDWLLRLLEALENKTVLAAQLDPARVQQLKNHPDGQIRRKAEALLQGQVAADRKKVVDDYRSALDLNADAAKGKLVFKKTCATCHRLENEGIEVGPDLLSALRNKTREVLIIDILDPSREVEPRYVNYLVTTKAGRIMTGMIAVETPTSLTLRRAEKAEDTLLRSQIEEIQATTKSLMPEELEKLLSKQDLADLIAYLQAVATPR